MRRFLSVLAIAFAGLVVPVFTPPLSPPCSGPAKASAQESADEEDPGASRATAFRSVSGPQVESIPGGVLLVSAYGAIWVLVLLFIVRLGRIQARAARDIERLERSLAGGGDGG